MKQYSYNMHSTQLNVAASAAVFVVHSFAMVQRTQPMYNLTDAVAHTFFVDNDQWLGHTANCSVSFDAKQLQKKFKHAADFGVGGTYSKQNSAIYQQDLEAHINSSDTRVIQETYLKQPVTH